MSKNLSQIKRKNLIDKIGKLKAFLEAQNATPEMRSYLTELESELKRQKFGLVFEEHREEIDEILETHTPILTEDKSLFINNGGQMNFLIEGDNLAALKLLEKTHKGKIDVIYIDPPYNTGAKDWKYDNNYVDSNDLFKHSKWLSFMKPRLEIAKTLMKENAVLICTIDKYEVRQVGMLLDELFADRETTLITIVHNPSGTQGKNFSHNNEYAYFVYRGERKSINPEKRDDEDADVRSFMNGAKGKGDNYKRESGVTCFYPIFVKDMQVIGFGDVCEKSFHPTGTNVTRQDGIMEIYPIDNDGVERKWLFGRNSVGEVKDELSVKFNKKRNIYEIIRVKKLINYKTVWDNPKYNAKTYGTQLLNNLIDIDFPFPKSLYAVMDCIKACVHNKHNSIILDFFAGSGTTGHAVMKLNNNDGGTRRFILCTNNDNGHKICREITYERIKTVITGKRKDGTKYSDGLPASLKYQRVDFLATAEQVYYDYAHELLKHIKELVELENAINFDGNTKLDILLTEDEVEKFLGKVAKLQTVRTIYLGHDVALTFEQQKVLTDNGIIVNVIPEYYYKEGQL